MALLSPFFATQFFDNTGAPAAGYLLHTYSSGTTTAKNTYTDQAGSVLNTNPIVLDSAGRCLLWLGSGEYSFVLADANDVVIETWDDVAGVPSSVTGSYLPLAGGTMTGLITLSGNATSALNPTPLQQVTELIAAAAPSGANVTIADAGGYFTTDTVEAALQQLGAAHSLVRVTPFTSSSTWTKPSDVRAIVVEGVGGGGGSGTTYTGCGSGGAGGYFRKFISAAAASYVVTIGAGGAAGSAGGNTTFGSVCTGNGGAAGATSNGGAGGAASGGDINLTGGGGGYGLNESTNAHFGPGGNSFFGGGAPGTINTSAAGNGASNTGGGGTAGTGGGGSGGSGVVIVYEYS